MASRQTIAVSILAEASGVRKGVAQANQSLGSITRTASRLGSVIKAAFVYGAIASGVKSLAQTASDAQQSIGAVEQIYGKYADSVIAKSKKAASAVGLSANSYRELSSPLAAMLKNAGSPMDKLGGKTDRLVKIAADMAATFGGPTKDAVAAVGSLMRGEADPIERYGVSIKQSDVNARLAAQGLKGLTGTKLKEAEASARLFLLYKQTKDVQGQFSRESKTLAGQQQRLAARFDNLKAAVGQRLLLPLTTLLLAIGDKLPKALALGRKAANDLRPAFVKVRGVLSGMLPSLEQMRSAVTKVFTFLSKNKESVATFVGVLVTLTAAVKVFTIAQAALNVVMNLNPISLIVIGLAGLAAGLVYAYQHSEKFRIVVQTAFAAIQKVASVVFPIVKAVVVTAFRVIATGVRAHIAVVSGVVRAIVATVREFGTVAATVKDKVVGAFSTIKTKIKNAFDGFSLKEIGKDIINGLIKGISQSKEAIKRAIGNVGDAIKDKIKGMFGIKSPSTWMRDQVGVQLTAGISQGLTLGTPSVQRQLTDLLVAPDITLGSGTYSGRSARNAAPQSVVINAKFDNRMTEAEMGVVFDRALEAARQKGLIRR